MDSTSNSNLTPMTPSSCSGGPVLVRMSGCWDITSLVKKEPRATCQWLRRQIVYLESTKPFVESRDDLNKVEETIRRCRQRLAQLEEAYYL